MRAAVVGLAGPALLPEERELFARLPPAGFILFARNIHEPAQLQALVAELRALVPEAWLFVDQEGGRVQRLGPPFLPPLPPAAVLGAVARADPAAGLELVSLWAAALAASVAAAGLDANCAPVLDVAEEDTTEAIGDRAFGRDPELVGRLGRLVVATFRTFGIAGVIKHFPGHGRARVDSHKTLPRIEASCEQLKARDLIPFRHGRTAPFAMTGHLLCPALDPERPASLSPAVHRLLRQELGFRGLVLSDDLAMGALTGRPGERVQAARAAGADLALWCPGDADATAEVLAAAGDVAPPVRRRLQQLRQDLTRRRRPLPAASLAAELQRRLARHHG